MKIGKEILIYSFPVGFLFIMAILYVISWPITAFNGNFYHLAVLYLLLFLISIIFLIKDIKKINFKFQRKYWILFFILVFIEIFISYRRTLGDPHGFDPLYYINMISFNIGNKELNSLHPHFGTYPNTDVQWITYVFQSYYYLIATTIWSVRNILSLIGLSFETMPAIVWPYQIFCTMFLIATAIISIKEVNNKNKIFQLFSIILLVLFIGNFYFNNVFGFIGNNYRMSIHALATIYLFRYFKDRDKGDFIIFLIMMLGMCAMSSTGTFALIFALVGIFFTECDKNKDLIKYYSLACLIPVINILVVKLGQNWLIPIAVIILFAIIYFLNDFILKIFKNIKVRYVVIICGFIILSLLSFNITHNIFDFHVFFNNYSEIQDMSWDYFMFSDIRHYIFNLIVLIPLTYYLIKNRKSQFAVMSWILIILFYNPFACTFMNKINWVYYRTYDIIINQFTIIYFLNYLIKDISNIYVKKTITVSMLCVSIILAVIQIPRYYHETFKPDADYNPVMKIENSELELIYNIREMVKDLNIEHPRIINQTFYMAPYIEGSTYLIGKEKRYNYNQFDANSYALYLIFFPVDGWDNFRPDEQPDYDHVIDLLKESDYDILIIDYGLFAEYKGNYISLADAVESDGTYHRSNYSTAKYAVYYIGD